MLKKHLTALLSVTAVILLLFEICSFASLSGAKSPFSAEQTGVKWTLSLGTDYKNAPSIPALYGDYIYVMSGKKIHKIKKDNGEIIKSADMSGRPTYAYIPVTVENGKVFCPVGNGIIEAFSADTLEKLWSVTDPLSGQAMTPITFSGGKIFTGFWNSETDDANFVCVDASNGKFLWSLRRKGGYYWSQCAIYGSYAIIGGENGSDSVSAEGQVHCVNISSGNITDSIDVSGDMRSGITCSGNTVWMVTKAAKLYKTSVGSDGKFGKVYQTDIAGYSTSTPTVYDGSIYIGMSGGSVKEGYVGIFDAQTLAETARVKVPGFPQCEILVCSAYDSPVAYTTYNNGPGGIITVTKSGSEYSAQEIFTPETGARGFCISTVVADTDGDLYYKNDSGTIFALTFSNGQQEESGSNIISAILSFFRLIIEFIISLF